MLLRLLPQLGEVLAALFVLFDPLACKTAILDARQHFLHRLARLVADDHLAARQIAVLGGVRNRIAHPAEAAFVDQVDDQLHLMHALEVRNLRSVAGSDQRLESLLHQRSQASAQHGLLAEQVALGLFLESGLQHTSARGADAMRIAERVFVRMAAGILMDRQQRRHPAALGVHAPQQVAGALGRDHDYVDVWGRGNGLEVNREAVREAEDFALVQMRLDRRFVEGSWAWGKKRAGWRPRLE